MKILPYLSRLSRKALLVALVGTSLLINSCKKELLVSEDNRPLSIALAKDFFETTILPKTGTTNPITTQSSGFSLKSLLKLTDWDKARMDKISLGDAVMVPIAYDSRTFVVTDPIHKKGIDLEKLSYLMVYKDKKKKLRAEWVTYIPDSTWINGNRARFIGKVIVRDWYGKTIKGYIYNPNGKVDSVTFQNKKLASTKSPLLCYSYTTQKCIGHATTPASIANPKAPTVKIVTGECNAWLIETHEDCAFLDDSAPTEGGGGEMGGTGGGGGHGTTEDEGGGDAGNSGDYPIINCPVILIGVKGPAKTYTGDCPNYNPTNLPSAEALALEAKVLLVAQAFQLDEDEANVLRNNSFMLAEIEEVMENELIDIDVQAGLKNTLDAYRTNAFSGAQAVALLNQNYAIGIDPMVEAYFSINVAIIKYQHPDWSLFRVYWEASKEMIHFALDVGGMVPVIGEICDLTNGGIYALQGDGINASLSLVSAIPIAGWFSTGAKFAIKAVDATGTVKTTLKWVKKANGVIDFGLRSQLRKTLKLLPGNALQAHHLIPWEYTEHAVVQKAAQYGFHMNEAINGIGLAKSIHVEGMVHQTYNNVVRGKLDEILQNFGDAQGNINPQVAETQLINLTNQIKSWIASHPGVNLNNIAL